MKRVLLINEGRSENFGDQAILLILEYVLSLNEVDVSFLDFAHTYIKEVDNNFVKRNILAKILSKVVCAKLKWLIKNRSRLYRAYRLRKNYDIVLIGGGQLILANKYFSVAFYAWTYIYKNANLHIFSVGCSDKLTMIDKVLYNFSLRRANTISMRDENSLINFKRFFKYKAKKIVDPVFAIDKIKPMNNIKLNDGAIGIAFVNYSDYRKYNTCSEDEYEALCINVINKFLTKNKRIKLFYTTKLDKSFMKKIKSSYLTKFGVELFLEDIDDLNDLISCINDYTLVISSRMHALIIAASYGVKIFAIEYSDKLAGFSKEFVHRRIDSQNIFNKINKSIRELIDFNI